MTDRVKPRRRYHSPRRLEQSAATRAAILEAAERLFEKRGFAATTMPAIAAEAGVALKTIYVGFATKSGLLHALWDLRLSGDEQPIRVVQRAWYVQLLKEPDPKHQLHGLAHQSRVVKARAGTVMEVIRNGAAADPSIAELWQLIQKEFRDVIRPFARNLHAKGVLAEGLGVAGATDILWTLSHPDLWQLLVGQCGWSSARYERWLTAAFCAQLLDPAASSGAGGGGLAAASS